MQLNHFSNNFSLLIIDRGDRGNNCRNFREMQFIQQQKISKKLKFTEKTYNCVKSLEILTVFILNINNNSKYKRQQLTQNIQVTL